MCANLPIWREEDRREPFSALIFTGNRLAEIRPLVESLSSDWYLARTDNHGLLYLRGTPTAKEVVVDPNSFTDPRSKAIFLSQSALVLDAMSRQAEARQMMQKSVEVFSGDSTVWVNSAMLAASQKRWPQTRKNAESALNLTPDSVQARYLLALALLESDFISQAATESARLIRQNPLDPQILQLQARISEANNDFTAEIDALERLLALETKANQATSPIHLYLGQAWARKGFASQALANYESALQGSLSPLQKSEIQSAIQNIRQKSGPTQTADH
jgi:tetratricopeptide (TPR) repeat protein